MSAEERLEATVIGRVQGVGFRFFVLREARSLGLCGWVANTAAGGVHVVAEGPAPDLDALADRLRAGPPSAIVERVIERRAPAREGFGGFEIRSGAHRGD